MSTIHIMCVSWDGFFCFVYVCYFKYLSNLACFFKENLFFSDYIDWLVQKFCLEIGKKHLSSN